MSIGHDAHRRVSVFTVIEKKERRARERERQRERGREREREFYAIEPCTGVIYWTLSRPLPLNFRPILPAPAMILFLTARGDRTATAPARKQRESPI